MARRKPLVLPGQLLWFPEWKQQCPLCGAAGDLVTCRRVYEVKERCVRCAEALKPHGWKIVGEKPQR
jgi:hypothetical protein